MKCYFCSNAIRLESIRDIFFYQYLCNNCNNLFQYTTRNGKIKTLVCILYIFIYYEDILYYTNSDKYDKIRIRLINEHGIKNKYLTLSQLCIKLNDNSLKYTRKLVIVFYRPQYEELIKTLKIVANRELAKKVVAFELIK